MSKATTLSELLKTYILEIKKTLNTAIPGSIIAFDPDTQLAQVQIGINTVLHNGKQITIAPLVECPVCFQGGKNFTLEFQIDTGDEGLIIFSQRAIDDWSNQGGPVNQNVVRFHNINDAMFIPGIRSNPNAIKSHANNGIRIRNNDASSYFWLKNDGTGAIKVSTLNVDGVIINNGTNVTTHTHSQPNDSGGNTEQDTGEMI